MKKDSISDHELLVLIHKKTDIEKLKKQNKTITKRRIDKLFQKLKNSVKREGLSTSEKTEKVVSNTNKKFDFLIVNVDGASRGNPGKAGIGIAIYDKDLNLVKEVSEYIGIATNNVAEYKAMIFGIKESIRHNAQETLFKTDSELLVKQVMGKYRVKSIQLMYLFTEVQSLLKRLPKWRIEHIPREENKKADMLANKGIEISIKNKLTNPSFPLC